MKGKGRKKQGPVKIVDFDDTLFFSKRSLKLATREVVGRELSREEVRKLPKSLKKRIYGLSGGKYLKFSEPNTAMINLLRRSAKNSKIIVLTARMSGVAKRTVSFLIGNDVPFDLAIFRTILKIDDEVWKAGQLRTLLMHAGPTEIYEDKLENIEYFKEHLNSENVAYFLVSENGIARV
ncbi:MAG: hypothetical protein ABSD68_01040 [Candidatus Micrarchaeales archaeon]